MISLMKTMRSQWGRYSFPKHVMNMRLFHVYLAQLETNFGFLSRLGPMVNYPRSGCPGPSSIPLFWDPVSCCFWNLEGFRFWGLSIFSGSPSIYKVPYLVATLRCREIEQDRESFILPNHAEAMFGKTHRFGGLQAPRFQHVPTCSDTSQFDSASHGVCLRIMSTASKSKHIKTIQNPVW